MSDATGSAGPLAGTRVIELGVWVAGPAAAGIMADWGADVIKVEEESGDPQRALFSSVGIRADLPVPPFEVDNRGKRSVVMNLRDPGDVERFHALLATRTCSCRTCAQARWNGSGSTTRRCVPGIRRSSTA